MRTARRIRIDLAYDGTDFAGFQFQPGQRTVQGVLESALTRIQGSGGVRVRAAGRTDAGAHARAQVADCELASRLADSDLLHALRQVLPQDVRPVELATVPASFHSRRDASDKTYRYRLDRSAHGDPFLARFSLHYPHAIPLEVMDRALACLPGERDWSAFTARSCRIEDRVRRLTEARFEEEHGEAWFTFSANGFLTHMVRNLVGSLLDVARGRLPVDGLPGIIESRDRGRAGATAPARGLVLWRVRYRCRRESASV